MNKKLLFILPLAVLGLASCNLKIKNTDTSIVTPTTTPTTAPIINPTTAPTTKPTAVPTATPTVVPTASAPVITTGEFETPEITGPINKNELKFNKKHFDESLKKTGPLCEDALPSIGSPNVLVVPVNLDNSKKTDKILSDINIAFNGTSSQTGWESVNSYYKKSSYGKLDIKFTVEDWYTPSHSASYYVNYQSGDKTGTDLILEEVLDNFDSKYDYSDYDLDNDGYIDTVWLIYNSDVAFANVTKYNSDEEDFYWAYSTWYYDDVMWDNTYAEYYAFAGTDFMYSLEEKSYDDTNIIVDAHTYIHETGHLLGLDDYYDYDENIGKGMGLYGADMMDYNIGDHGPINKILLGWIDPIVVDTNGSGTIDLKPFTTTGECIVIANHKLDSIYDEYFILDYYTNDGLNSNDLPIYDGYVDAKGIRVVHVDAHINYNNKKEVELNSGDYQSGFKYDNSDESKPFIEMLRADYSNNMDEYLYGESLYTNGMTFGNDVWKSYKLNDGSNIFFTFKVNNVSDDVINITLSI